MSTETIQTPQTQTQPPVVTLTANTIAKLKAIFAEDPQAKGKSLRIGIESGGCSGFQYVFGFDEKREGDQVAGAEGIEVLIDAQTAVHLKGSVIDYVQDFAGEGFAIQNPNVKKSCGCGSSMEF